MSGLSKSLALHRRKPLTPEQLLAMQEFRATVKALQGDTKSDPNRVSDYKVTS